MAFAAESSAILCYLCFRPANRATVDVVFGITVTATSLLLGEVGLVADPPLASRLFCPKVDLENGWEFTELHEARVALAK